ncbi:hypothetical protein MUG10_01115 [Xanthomonas prunicola]|uniref:hypothetical protein n=1 Tax=Xanthomonas prunicola TaxID=2053930 RepID=UPI002078EA05|nr:hypothetical protein [Xanthomonas prunicola]USJ00897.1 hypothetical protein MUG10_01115 [Xanthomonas prunicola]
MSMLELQTLQLPRGEDAARKDATAPKDFTGFVVGALFVHHAVSDDETTLMGAFGECGIGDWNVTHIASGFALQKGIPTHRRAIWLATQLMTFPGMDAQTVEECRRAAAPHRDAITTLCIDAKQGDCQGNCNGSISELRGAL